MNKVQRQEETQILRSFLEREDTPEFNKDAEYTFSLAQLAAIKKVVIIGYDFKKNSIEYISPNVIEILGYNKEFFYGIGIKNFTSKISIIHNGYFNTRSTIMKDLLPNMHLTSSDNFKLVTCGLKFKTPTGIIKLLLKHLILEKNLNNEPIKSLYFIQNITHFLKGDFFWTRMVFGDPPQLLKTYSSELKEFSKDDILSTEKKKY